MATIRHGISKNTEIYGRVSGLVSNKRSQNFLSPEIVNDSNNHFSSSWIGVNHRFREDFDNKPALLGFGLCNLRVHELIKNYQEMKNNLEIIAVFQSPVSKIQQYVGIQDIPFTVLPDPNKSMYKLYGVETSWRGFAKAWTLKISQVINAVLKHKYLPGSVEGEIHRIPADFIIDTDNKILKAYYGKDIGDHLPLSEIQTLINTYETRQ